MHSDCLCRSFHAHPRNFYEINVSRSLGGALATLFAFNLAGGGASEDMLGAQRVAIPKPVKCITFGAPPSGTLEFRTAFEVRKTFRGYVSIVLLHL